MPIPAPAAITPFFKVGPDISLRFSIYSSAKLLANALKGLVSTSAKAIEPSSVIVIPGVICSTAPCRTRGTFTAVLKKEPNAAPAVLTATLPIPFSANLPSSFVVAVLAAAEPDLNIGPVKRNSTINPGNSVMPSAIRPPTEIPLACFSSKSITHASNLLRAALVSLSLAVRVTLVGAANGIELIEAMSIVLPVLINCISFQRVVITPVLYAEPTKGNFAKTLVWERVSTKPIFVSANWSLSSLFRAEWWSIISEVGILRKLGS